MVWVRRASGSDRCSLGLVGPRLASWDLEARVQPPRKPQGVASGVLLPHTPPALTKPSESPEELARFLAETDLFRNAPPEGRAAVAAALETTHLPGGGSLFCEGNLERSLYVVRRGRVRVELRNRFGDIVPIEVARGGFFGELATLNGSEQSAVVFGVRDTELLTLAPEAIKEVATQNPHLLWEMMQVVLERFGRALRGERRDAQIVNLALLPRAENPLIRGAARQLEASLGRVCSTLRIDTERLSREFGPEAAQIEWDDSRNHQVLSWLEEMERKYRFLLCEGSPRRDAWTSRCLRQADRILIIATSDIAPHMDALREMHVFEDRCTLSDVRVEVLIVHPAGTTLPTGGGRWRTQKETQRLYHARADNASDFDRIARCLTNQSVGVVLGGGGARGLAHIGALKALEEAQVPIDVIGGTSVGSIFAAGPAMGWDAQQILEKARGVFRRRSSIVDVTFPYLSLLSGTKLTGVLKELFGDAELENLWREYFCISVNLSGSQLQVHDRGPLWRNIRSSCALPGIFPPVHTGGEIFIDGGVMNGLPTDVMAQRNGGGPVIAIDVGGSAEDTGHPFAESFSGWGALYRRLTPFVTKKKTLTIFDVLLRSNVVSSRARGAASRDAADLYVRPNVQSFGLLDFSPVDELYHIGYEATKKALENWSLPSASCDLPL